MQIGAMNHPARPVLDEIEWIGTNGFDFVDLPLEPPAADPGQSAFGRRCLVHARHPTAARGRRKAGRLLRSSWASRPQPW